MDILGNTNTDKKINFIYTVTLITVGLTVLNIVATFLKK